VLSGSAGAANSPGNFSGSKAVPVDPPDPKPAHESRVLAPKDGTELVMARQRLTDWCWDAVAVWAHNLLNPESPWTPDELATRVLQDEGQIGESDDCSKMLNRCNVPEALDVALKATGNLDQTLPGQYLTFSSIVAQIKAGYPVGARIAWFGGGAHFVAVDGYRDFGALGQQVHVQDPLRGPGLLDYNVFVSNYPPGGSWNDTYLMKVAKPAESRVATGLG